MQHDHKNTLSQRNSNEIHHHPRHHFGRHNRTGSNDHTVRQELGWQRDLHHNSQWGILMATKRTKPGSEDRATVSQLVLDGMRSGLSAFKACQAAGVPQSTFSRWCDDDATLAENYARAREALIEKMANELLEIADTPVGSTDSGATDSGAVQKQRLQVDTRKWLLSKLAPKKFGDKIEVSGDPANPLVQRIERVVVKA
jgi:hypothetical protein